MDAKYHSFIINLLHYLQHNQKPNNQQTRKMATCTLRPHAVKASSESQVVTLPDNPIGGITPIGSTMPTQVDRHLGSY